MLAIKVLFLSLLVVSNAQPSREDEDGGHDEEGHQHADDLTNEQHEIFDSLDLAGLLNRMNVLENAALNETKVEEFLNLVSEGVFAEKPIEDAMEGDVERFLLLTPDLLLDEFGNGQVLTQTQFEQSIPTVLSCVADERCALITDEAFIEHHENEEDHDEHENHDHDEEDHDEHENHDHDEEDHDEHENHDHENEEHEAHGHGDEHEDHHHEDDDDDDDDEHMDIKSIALVVLFIEAIIGSMIPVSVGSFKGFKEVLSVLNCFAGGVLMSTGLIHLVPHVIEYEAEVDNLGDYPLGMVMVTVGYCLVFFVEHILFDAHSHTSEVQDRTLKESTSQEDLEAVQNHDWKHCVLLLAATAVHSVLEALVLGLQEDSYSVWILFASIAGHKGVTAMAISARFIKSHINTWQVIGFSTVFALTAPISILIGTALDDVPATVNLILTALSTGTFLYIGAYEVISEEFKKKGTSEESSLTGISRFITSRYVKFLAIVCGLAVISGVAFIPHAGHDHGDGHGHGH